MARDVRTAGRKRESQIGHAAMKGTARYTRAMSDTEALVLAAPPRDGVAVLTLNRPAKKNALSIALRDALSDAIEPLAADQACKVVVLTGAGDFFSAGFDLKEFAGDEAHVARLWASSDRYHRAILECPLPTIAAINGPALAGGFDTAVLCDMRIASTKAHFAHPEHAWADVVYAPLESLVGGAVARDLVLTGRKIDAEEALRLGVVTRLAAPEALMATAMEVAKTVAKAPRDALMRTKAKFRDRARIAFRTTLAL
jgi:enoyl-CoA hydratase